MSRFILDISANTHKNDWEYLKKMLDEVKRVDTGKHEIIIKHQLFEKAGDNIPLDTDIFYKAYHYAKDELGYKTTSSVFDLPSLKCLLNYDVPFIKIANNRALDWLIAETPRKIPIYKSIGSSDERFSGSKLAFITSCEMCCVSEYPAKAEDYKQAFSAEELKKGISDHTTDWKLFNKFKPEVYEVHMKLEDSTGLDAGEFARTPEQLSEVL